MALFEMVNKALQWFAGLTDIRTPIIRNVIIEDDISVAAIDRPVTIIIPLL